jgi:spermidine synthase
MSELDAQIQAALENLRHGRGAREFDIVRYIAAFQQSAHEKAQSVLDLLSAQSTFSGLNPVFLSVGGGDGAELEYLLRHSTAAAGVLLEGARPLADGARKRASELPGGKEMTVFEGDAKQTIKDGMQTELASHEFTVKK